MKSNFNLCFGTLLLSGLCVAQLWAAVSTNDNSGLIAAVAIAEVHRQTAQEDLLLQAESRLRANYDRDEFRRCVWAWWMPRERKLAGFPFPYWLRA